MTDAHRVSLAEKHAQLEQTLSREASAPLPDSIVLATLKKKKLRIKEQLARP